MFSVLPPEVTENDPINRLSALLAAVEQELLQHHSYINTELYKIFGTFPVFMEHRDEVNVSKSQYLLYYCVITQGFKLPPILWKS